MLSMNNLLNVCSTDQKFLLGLPDSQLTIFFCVQHLENYVLFVCMH